MDDITPIRKPEIVGEAGDLVDESRLTLGVYGDDLDPDEISRILGVTPTSAHRRGEPRRSGPPWPADAWLLSVEGKSPTGPEELVRLLLVRLPVDGDLWADLRRRFRLRLSFGIFTERWNRGFELSSEAIRLVDSLGSGMGVDIYTNLEDDG
jgi:hypothetical protein